MSTTESSTTTVYGASPVKRVRRTNAELATINGAIIDAVHLEHPVTVRGVYYRVVSAGAVPKTEAGYNVVARQLLKLRRDGTIPYSYITDGTRWITQPTTWGGLDQMLDDAAASYRRALWHSQNVDVHVYTEKDAISGAILPVTYRWDVPLGVLRGYTSESFAYSVAMSLDPSKVTFIYQLGDHDASGVNAWEDFQRKVKGFTTAVVVFERLAVTPEQIVQWDLPTRPQKKTDTRAKGFEGECVEVDAVPPTRLRDLLQAAIEQHIDPRALTLEQQVEAEERNTLQLMRGML